MPQNQNVKNQKLTTKKHLNGFWGARVVEGFILYNQRKSREEILERE